MQRASLSACLSLVALITACASDELPPLPDRGVTPDKGSVDRGALDRGALDQEVDTAVLRDQTADKPRDAGVDQATDAQPDAQSDGASDGSPDIAPDLYADCTGKPDGTPCGQDVICLKEQCVAGRCGDGFVDTASGEDCEDGNETPGDGCTNCRYDCRNNPDCSDGDSCNGDEGCLNHKCVSGTPRADGDSCTQLSGHPGVCSGQKCVAAGCGNGVHEPANGEECDDGNTTPNDGCELDCKLSCKSNGDCDDGNLCNGQESCDGSNPQKPVCKSSSAVVCQAKTNCNGTCDPTTGLCNYPDNDRDGSSCIDDCNDFDPAVFPGAPECADAKDNDCNPNTPDGADGSCLCYVDKDEDGFAASGAASITSINCPRGYTPTPPEKGTTDCNDSRSDVYPKQSAWFDVPYSVKLLISYDYDCSGKWDKRYTALYSSCRPDSRSKSGCSGSGWRATSPPSCGVEEDYVSCSSAGFNLCFQFVSKRKQQCH
jgi:cysteine-rich repeat protein